MFHIGNATMGDWMVSGGSIGTPSSRSAWSKAAWAGEGPRDQCGEALQPAVL